MEQKTDQTEIGKTPIGFNRYKFLKNINPNDLTETEIEQIKEYEEKHIPSDVQIKYKELYIDKIRSDKEVVFSFDKKTLWFEFLRKFKEVNDVDFIQTEESIENLKTIFLYFLKDNDFLFCKNVSTLSKPSFDKGLLIIGNFGNGKTSVMMTFESIFKYVKGYSFKSYSANAVVTMFESIKSDDFSELSKADFERRMNNGVRYFDDVKTERIASNFGKVNLFKDILESREKNNALTYITCNYKDGYPENVEEALNEFEDKYGSRVYDRLFKMFNIIEFKGKSFRV